MELLPMAELVLKQSVKAHGPLVFSYMLINLRALQLKTPTTNLNTSWPHWSADTTAGSPLGVKYSREALYYFCILPRFNTDISNGATVRVLFVPYDGVGWSRHKKVIIREIRIAISLMNLMYVFCIHILSLLRGCIFFVMSECSSNFQQIRDQYGYTTVAIAICNYRPRSLIGHNMRKSIFQYAMYMQPAKVITQN